MLCTPCLVVSFSHEGFVLGNTQGSRIGVPDDRVAVGELLGTDSTATNQPACLFELARFVFPVQHIGPRHRESGANDFGVPTCTTSASGSP